MIHMTKCDSWITTGCIVLGCELLSEFRRNGSENSIQQKIINPSNGFTWLSAYDYRGLIKPDEVYELHFGIEGYDSWVHDAPAFVIEHAYEYALKAVHQDPFPNAAPEIRDKYKRDSVIVDLVYIPIGHEEKSPMYCVYDSINK